MPHPDAERWNSRYREEARYARFTEPRPFLVQHAALLPASGLALDAAMGLGGNAGFLLRHGLKVVGVDISSVALREAQRRLPGLLPVLADLTRFPLPEDTFDVIVNFFYLERGLWPQYARALRAGGVLVFETLTQEMLPRLPEVDPAYLLAPGELRRAFPTLETLAYAEGWSASDSSHPRATAGLVARKPGDAPG